MESQNPGIQNQKSSTSIPQSSDHSEQAAHQPGFMWSELGRSPGVPFQDYQHHPQPHPLPLVSSQSYEIQEAIQREIEKSRIREEIIMSEFMRRRMLESEVRRELIMERELALRRAGINGFSFGMQSVTGVGSPVRLPAMGSLAEGRLQDERNVFLYPEKERLNGMCESGWHNTMPFQRGPTRLRVSEVKSVAEGSKEKEKTILLTKHDEMCGSKRKAVTPSPTVDASECPRDDILRKRAKDEWSCALCQVSATCERGLKEHLEGKKHKAREAKLKAEGARKNDSKGVFSKKDAKPVTVQGSACPGAEDGPKSKTESLPSQKAGEANDQKLLQINACSDSLNEKHLMVAQKAQKTDYPNNRKMKFWCEMCQVGANSKKVMDCHTKGKKHIARLLKSHQTCGANQSDKNDKIVNHEGVAKDDKNVSSDKVSDSLDESGSIHHVPTDSVKPEEDCKTADENETKDCGVDDTAIPGNDASTNSDALSKSHDEPTGS